MPVYEYTALDKKGKTVENRNYEAEKKRADDRLQQLRERQATIMSQLQGAASAGLAPGAPAAQQAETQTAPIDPAAMPAELGIDDLTDEEAVRAAQAMTLGYNKQKIIMAIRRSRMARNNQRITQQIGLT